MDRRTLLKLLALNAAILPFPLSADTAKHLQNKHLILIELKGGNDGINTLIPYSDPLYYRLRPNIAIPKSELLTLDDQVALHPSMPGIKKIFDAGELAIIQGVGYPNPNRSHFRSIEIWDTASKSNEYLDDGWLDTLLPKQTGSLQGVVFGGTYGPLSGMDRSVIQINNIQRFLNQSKRIRAQIYITGDNDAMVHLLQTESEVRKSADMLSSYLKKKGTTLKFPFKKSNFGKQLNMAAQLINSNIDVPFFKLSLGGFDTHINQSKKHAGLLKQLSDGIFTLRENLIDSGAWENSVIMTYSEFGRRASENGSRGTDHGTAAPLFVAGGTIKGGLFGTYPPLSSLDKNGDLVYTTDFRSLYHTIAKDWLGASSRHIQAFPELSFFDTIQEKAFSK